MLSQILLPSARERCEPAPAAADADVHGKYPDSRVCASAVARIALVKPDKAKGVENLVIQLAQRGQIQERVRLCSTSRSLWCVRVQT